jgi:signal transduction histidine kinase
VAPRPGEPGFTAAKVRLTAMYALLVSLSGAFMLLVVNLTTSSRLPRVLVATWQGNPPTDLALAMPDDATGGGDLARQLLMARPGESALPTLPPGITQAVPSAPLSSGQLSGHTATRIAQATTGEFLRWSVILLLAMVVVSVLAGWWLAGRVLAPIRLAYDSQRQLVANMAHELRTPLTTQRAVLETAFGEVDDDDPAPAPSSRQQRAAGLRALELGAKTSDIVTSMLALARAQADGAVRSEPVDLGAVTRAAIAEYRELAASRQVVIDADLAANVPLTGDAALLERMAVNLVGNAIVHGQTPGRVEIRVGLAPSGDGVELRVSNPGEPIAPEAIANLVEPFRRTGRARTGGHDGHGLGLAIVQAVVAQHHGTLSLTPGPAGGLTATVHLPSGH